MPVYMRNILLDLPMQIQVKREKCSLMNSNHYVRLQSPLPSKTLHPLPAGAIVLKILFYSTYSLMSNSNLIFDSSLYRNY